MTLTLLITGSVTAQTIEETLDARGIEGPQRLSAVSGNIRTQQFDSMVEVSSVSGDIERCRE